MLFTTTDEYFWLVGEIAGLIPGYYDSNSSTILKSSLSNEPYQMDTVNKEDECHGPIIPLESGRPGLIPKVDLYVGCSLNSYDMQGEH